MPSDSGGGDGRKRRSRKEDKPKERPVGGPAEEH
jgi:hypothetical protein